MPPVYVIGRQHSGNTLLTSLLGQHPDVHAFLGEDTFFEYLSRFEEPLTEDDLDFLAWLVGKSQLPWVPIDERRELSSYFQEQINSHGPKTAVQLYQLGKSRRTRLAGAAHWVQKATSYIFYVSTIRSHFPDAQFIYLLRNPFDLATSLRVRRSSARWLRMAVGWKRGVERAVEFQRQHPARFRIVRYEDLVQEPIRCTEEIFEFCGLSFRKDYLSVDRINPAESPYETRQSGVGITDEKLHYYTEHLTPAEVDFIGRACGRDKVRFHYPQLVRNSRRPGPIDRLKTSRHLFSGLVHLAADTIRRVTRDPRPALARIARRLQV